MRHLIVGLLQQLGGDLLHLAWRLDAPDLMFCEWLTLYGYYYPEEEIAEKGSEE